MTAWIESGGKEQRMRRFGDYNPLTVAIYYIAVVTIAMFTMNPVLHLIAFSGGALQFSIQRVKHKVGTHLLFLVIGLILALLRPLFSHNGATVLFVINDNPITAQAFIFGINSAVMVVGVLYLFRVFSIIMTSDRLLYLFGRLSPKTALVMSMGLRYIPLLKEKSRQIGAAQTAVGINRDDNAIDRLKARMNVFSATVSWGLENGIITADSMAARGYGSGKRSCFRKFSITKADIILILIMVMLTGPSIAALITGDYDTVFYPHFEMSGLNFVSLAGYVTFAILMLIPVLIDSLESFR